MAPPAEGIAAYGAAHPPRVNPSRVSSSGSAGDCITPSNDRLMNRMILPIFSSVRTQSKKTLDISLDKVDNHLVNQI
jgi:hypothetical protein